MTCSALRLRPILSHAQSWTGPLTFHHKCAMHCTVSNDKVPLCAPMYVHMHIHVCVASRGPCMFPAYCVVCHFV